MTANVVPFTALQRMCRPNGPAPRASTVAKWADRQHIRYKYDGAGGIWTTQAALDAAVGLHAALSAANEETRIEDLMQ
ncbi:hypothetical protein [Pseudoxanthomonas sp. PXM02]|uniref:hypothetical protein n=1 Tax=Pseudoxanthomonas sp. PXM02 TaxID=2769294 RepID=UPI0017873649|nr:hypothetical protein [Pseudoxanthomonas sp. PXM02]MBD9478548.1 hypothetical protein [Pseudoxanthomonas sp. PXM02]